MSTNSDLLSALTNALGALQIATTRLDQATHLVAELVQQTMLQAPTVSAPDASSTPDEVKALGGKLLETMQAQFTQWADTQMKDLHAKIKSEVEDALDGYDFSSIVGDAVSDHDFSDVIAEALSDYDFSDVIENATSRHVDEYDFSESIEEAVSRHIDSHDFSQVIDEALTDKTKGLIEELEGSIESRVEQVIDPCLTAAVRSELNEFDFSDILREEFTSLVPKLRDAVLDTPNLAQDIVQVGLNMESNREVVRKIIARTLLGVEAAVPSSR